ncbi:hypothetical protein OB2597_13943 [Pseudooceanicola batsensis HTCC2597]|uniref:DUF3618 domain-containing protein n=1 Tax=Pseudooceanicola batsensis (strain ATCC BAA-863 / DSM 15984 / KCTC 12145 / HTCC2597) TaxID=252305 RepID=A3TYL7_PSEBH|nr:hypothetical protein [Pseudooceanicola batsensis]EAQ03251.1 hypothetical protein OB2597_13943 [Pseudooceanicola batsensis HTCC2597]
MTHQDDTGTGRDSADTAQDTAERLAQDGKDAVKSAKDRVSEEVSSQAEAGKSGVADEISDMGQALRTAAQELRNGSPQERTLGYMADTLADLSGTVRNKDLGELVDDVSGYARNNPMGFLAGAALLGFAGTRLAKASRRDRERSVDLRSYWDTDDHDEEVGRHITQRDAPATPPTPAPSTTSPAGAASHPAPGVRTTKGET